MEHTSYDDTCRACPGVSSGVSTQGGRSRTGSKSAAASCLVILPASDGAIAVAIAVTCGTIDRDDSGFHGSECMCEVNGLKLVANHTRRT
jgi:hypothetical protein